MSDPTINELIAEREQERMKAEPQPREHPVPCRKCYRRRTWNTNGLCNGCQNEK